MMQNKNIFLIRNFFRSNNVLSLSKNGSLSKAFLSRIFSKLFFRVVFIFVIILTSNINSQWKSELFPSQLNIQPFTANIIEPSTGFEFSLNKNQLELNISTSHDIIHWSNDDEVISVGADFFTFTRLRSTNDFKFPVETVDYLFGLNAGYKKKLCNDNEFGFRFRLSHISAHLVDGQFDAQTKIWHDDREPFVFSKEFIEIFPFYEFNTLRIYGGFTYLFHVIPDVIKKGNYQLGFDYFATQIGTDFFTPYISYDFKLNGVEKYIGNNNLLAGIKFGKWSERGLSIYFSYRSGLSIHGEYYDIYEKYSSIGFNFDL